jgi:hypothetical protein
MIAFGQAEFALHKESVTTIAIKPATHAIDDAQ